MAAMLIRKHANEVQRLAVLWANLEGLRVQLEGLLTVPGRFLRVANFQEDRGAKRSALW